MYTLEQIRHAARCIIAYHGQEKFNKIDVDILDMECYTNCVLGQMCNLQNGLDWLDKMHYLRDIFGEAIFPPAITASNLTREHWRAVVREYQANPPIVETKNNLEPLLTR